MSWEMVILVSVAKIGAGQSAPKDADFNESDGLSFIRAGHLEKLITYNNIHQLSKINRDYALKNKLKKLSKGSILFAKSGMSAMMNRVYMLEHDAYYVSHLASVVPNSEVLDSRYCYYFLKHFKTSNLIKDPAYPSIRLSDIENIQIPLPPLATQKRIADILDAADALRRKDQELLKKYDELAQAIFIDMFGDLETNFKNWIIKPLSEICTKITDGTHHTPEYVSDGIPFLRVTDITESNQSKKYITKNEHFNLIKRCNPEKGDVLYTKNGTIGVAKAIDWDYDFSIFVSLCLLKIKKDIVLPKYIESYLNTPIALKQAKKHSKTGTISNLHLVEIKQILVPIPPIKIQEDYLDLIENINLARKKTTGSDKLFNSLIQKAFKGELVA
jgi:type I restriction enzyme S subunit